MRKFPLRAVLTLLFAATLIQAPRQAVAKEGKHLVVGFDEKLCYDVEIGGQVVLRNLLPTRAGVLRFTAQIPAHHLRIYTTMQTAELPAKREAEIRFAVNGPYPNPSRGPVSFEVHSTERSTVRLALIPAATGSMRYEVSAAIAPGVTGVTFEIPPRLPSGVYLIRLTSGAHVVIRKLIILRD